MKREDALKVTCPKCGAPPSLPCMGKKRARLACHIERHPNAWDGKRGPGKQVREKRCNVIGWVYFVGHPNDDLVKIGWTGRSPERRLAMLQTGNGLELFILVCLRGTRRIEQELRDRFAAIRTTGEWFRVNDVTLMALVWPMDLPTTDKVVLLALADAANDDGVTWIAVHTRKQGEKLDLKKKCSLSDRAIQGAIKRLEAAGLIKRDERPGKGCVYTVKPPQQMRPAANAPPQEKTPTPAANAGKPSVTITTEAKASATRIIDRWNERSKESGIPAVRVLNHSRSQMLASRLKEHGEAAMLEAVDNVHDSEFCRGLKGDGRKADIMLILQPKTLPRVLERFYNDNDPTKKKYISATGYEYRGELEQMMRDAQRRGDNQTYWLMAADKSRAGQSKAAA